MDLSVGSILAPYVALAAMLLGISLLVQVLQELWKFSTSSKAIAFEKALDDFVGTWAAAHLRQNTTMAVRGPLQFRRVSKAGHVLPTEKGDLIAALEQASPTWHRLIDQVFQFESLLQQGMPGEPSPKMKELLGSLEAEVASARPATQALEVHDFLKTWGIAPTAVFDAAKARVALRHQFFTHLTPLELHYERLMQNFQYVYERRNLRQTFTWALAIALLFNLPLAGIYRRAAALPLADALALSERAQALHAEYTKLEAERARAAGGPADPTLQALQAREQRLRAAADEALQISAGRSINTDVRSLVGEMKTNIRSLSFLVGCLLTATLVSFGAPFWNDISTALYRIAKPGGARQLDQGARA
jgi:hypothetical protein